MALMPAAVILPQAPGGSVNPTNLAGFGILGSNKAHIRQLFFPRVDDVDADDIVPTGGDAQGRVVTFGQEIGQDEADAAFFDEVVEVLQGTADIRAAFLRLKVD